jgi:TonB-dependent receptor
MTYQLAIRTSAIALAIGISCANMAHAQDAPANGAAEAGAPTTASMGAGSDQSADIVVTGFRSSLARALDEKRQSAAAIDSIVAEDIAKFPDNNLAESVQRIPGVTISRDGGEGRSLSVRGLGPEFTRVRLNGMEALATSSGISSSGGTNRGRGFDFNVFASELFSNITVRKTPSAEVDEGSLGATVDLTSGHPFDYKGFKLAGSAQLGYSDQAKKADPRVAGLISDTFADGKIGILLSGAYSRRHSRIEGSNSGQWDFGSDNGGFGASLDPDIPLSELNSDTLYHPRFPRYGLYLLDEKRLGLTGSVQFKPTDKTLITFDAMYAKLDMHRNEKYLEAISMSRAGSQGGKPEMTLLDGEIDDNLLLYGKFDGVDLRAEDYVSNFTTKFQQYNLEWKQDLGDRVHLRAYGGISDSALDVFDTTVQMDRLNSNGYSFDYRQDPKHPILDYGFDVTDPANWYIGPLVNPLGGTPNQGPEIRIRPLQTDNKFRVGQFDAAFDVIEGVQLKAGVQFKRFKFDSESQRMLSERDIPAIPDGHSVADLTTVVNTLKYLGASGSPTSWLSPDVSKFEQVYGIYSDTGFFQLLGAENPSSRGDIRSVTENDRSFYLQADFKGDVFGLHVYGDLGVRFVRTGQAATGYQNTATGYDQVTVKRDYDATLPAVNLAADLTDKLVLRLAASKVMTRPPLGSLTPGGSVNALSGNHSVTAGNPFLKPIRASTADAALEWYFARGSLLSVAGFYKNIGTYIQTLNEIRPFNTSGLPDSLLDGTGLKPTDPFTFSLPVNTPGGKLKGFEINYQQPLRFLPGLLSNLGLLLNYTYVDSDIDYITNSTTHTTTRASLVGLSNNAYNATLYYEDSRLSVRGSVAHRSSYLRAVPGPYLTDVSGTEGTTNVDASLSYKLTDNFTLSLEALNLTNEVDDVYVRSDHLTEDYRAGGRQFFAGVRFNF